jgi:putative transposase
MPRKPREEAEGAVHHLTLLGVAVRARHWRCLAYCLMSNHLHLLIETPRANLGVGMAWLHGGYARWFNRRHGRTGHVFERRYGSVRIHTDAQLWVVLRYIAMNPVEAGLCARPEEWRWSSAGGGKAWLDHSRVLEYLAANGGDAHQRYAALLNP